MPVISGTVAALTRSDLRLIEVVERDAWMDMYAAAPPDVTAQLGLHHRPADDGVLLVAGNLDNIQFNRLGALGTSAPARKETLDAAIAAFDGANVRNWIVHVAKDSEPLATLCAERGLVPHRRTWAKFFRDVMPAPSRTDLSIREIGPDQATAFGTVAAQAFGLPVVVANWFAGIVGRSRWHFFMAFDDDHPVATGAIFADGNAAWLGIGATVATHRGRGAQSALLAARIDAARRRGCEVLTTETGVPHPGEAGPSYKNIQRAGFRIAYLRPNFHRPVSHGPN